MPKISSYASQNLFSTDKYIKAKSGVNYSVLGSELGSGWIFYDSVVPTLGSSDDPTYTLVFAGVNLTNIISVGMRIKWTQNGTVRYGIVTAIAFSTNTTLTLYGGTDYDVENTTTYPITNFAFASVKAPYGFPLDPIKWTVTTTDAALQTQAAAVLNTWYNLGGISISIPIGAWRGYYEVCLQNRSVGAFGLAATLSSANNSESNAIYTLFIFAIAQFDLAAGYRAVEITVSSKTTYYLNAKTTDAGAPTIAFQGSVSPTIIKMVCAYL